MAPSRKANSVPPPPALDHPVVDTPDGRYFVHRGRLWRRSNPALPADEREQLVHALMAARRGVRDALRADDADAERRARAAVQAAKVALGERGPVWWGDGAPDYNRRLARNTPYAAWWAAQAAGEIPVTGARPAAAQAAGDAPPAPQS